MAIEGKYLAELEMWKMEAAVEIRKDCGELFALMYEKKGTGH